MTSRSTAISSGQHRPDTDAHNQARDLALQMVGWNRRVLELAGRGTAITRELAARGCSVTTVVGEAGTAADLFDVAAEVIAGDLNQPETLAGLSPVFDVAIGGSDLAGLESAQAVLNRMAHLLVPGGRIVLSLPNRAHADIRLARMQGRLETKDDGRSDASSAVGFTIETIGEMVERAGLAIIDLTRVRIPAFETPRAVDRLSVPTGTLDGLLSEPEAETSQFVFTAVRDDGERQVARLFLRHEELKTDLERALIGSANKSIDIDALTRQLQDARADSERHNSTIAELHLRIAALTDSLRQLQASGDRHSTTLHDATARAHQLQVDLASERARREASESDLESLKATKLFRYARVPRAIYAALLGKRR